jgi:hypothetical protein
MLAEARAGRERRLAELEALAGVDIETITKNQVSVTNAEIEDRDE